LLGGILTRQGLMMAAGCSSGVAGDYNKFAALIGNYFNESDDDDSGSEADVESCNIYMYSPNCCLHSFKMFIAVTVHKIVTEDAELGNSHCVIIKNNTN